MRQHSEDQAITPIDREGRRDLRLKVPVLQVEHRRLYGMRIERARIDLESSFKVSRSFGVIVLF